MKYFLFPFIALASCIAISYAQETNQQESLVETQIADAVAAYVEAFNKADSAALISLWSEDAAYTNRLTGEVITGKKAIQQEFDSLFKAMPGIKLIVNSESLQLLSPNVVIEHGTAILGNIEEVPYLAVYTKRDGTWLLDRVSDGDDPQTVSHYDQLKDLEWMVGTWIDEDDDTEVITTCQWAKNRNFLIRKFSLVSSTSEDQSGIQIVGYDASTKQVRSWTFDSNGGFAQAEWTQKKDRWYIRNKGVLADGQSSTMVNIVRRIDDDSFSWQTVERTVGSQILPNIDEVVISRLPSPLIPSAPLE